VLRRRVSYTGGPGTHDDKAICTENQGGLPARHLTSNSSLRELLLTGDVL